MSPTRQKAGLRNPPFLPQSYHPHDNEQNDYVIGASAAIDQPQYQDDEPDGDHHGGADHDVLERPSQRLRPHASESRATSNRLRKNWAGDSPRRERIRPTTRQASASLMTVDRILLGIAVQRHTVRMPLLPGWRRTGERTRSTAPAAHRADIDVDEARARVIPDAADVQTLGEPGDLRSGVSGYLDVHRHPGNVVAVLRDAAFSRRSIALVSGDR